MSLPVHVLSCACSCLCKAHARTSARRAVTPDTCIPPHPSPFGRHRAVKPPHAPPHSSTSLWPAPGAALWSQLPRGFHDSHLPHCCSTDCCQDRAREQCVHLDPQHLPRVLVGKCLEGFPWGPPRWSCGAATASCSESPVNPAARCTNMENTVQTALTSCFLWKVIPTKE